VPGWVILNPVPSEEKGNARLQTSGTQGTLGILGTLFSPPIFLTIKGKRGIFYIHLKMMIS
jgi:hypothetical protein